MKAILLVGLGGFIGSVARYKLGDLVMHLSAAERFPWNTFTVNVLGCLIIGLLSGLGDRYAVFGPDTKLFIFTGLLGGFTTFSSFGLDTLSLIRRDEIWHAALYAGASVILGLIAVWIGLKFITLIPH